MHDIFGLRTLILTGTALLALSAISPISAESLNDAFASAYHNNSTLEAERARQRATDEEVPQALSGWRPTVTATATQGHQISSNRTSTANGGIKTYDESNPGSLQITLNQPIFRGFKTVEGTAQAEAIVRAGRQQLLAVEQTTLFNAVQAYMNVVQARQILALRQKNVKVLQSQLNASDARFKVGELTRTDVAQSRASLNGAQGQVAMALANVKAAEANYRTVVGHMPGKLAMARMAPRPKSLESAYSIAQQTNPSILAAAQTQDASEHNINVQFGDLLPTVDLQASATTAWDQTGAGSSSSRAIIQGVVTVPIYEQGLRYSLVRQAKETASQNRIQVISAVRSVRESVTIAWNNIIATGQNLSAARAQVAATRLALNGVRQEYQVGSRSTIDVLNGEQSLVNGQISEVEAQHDELVASYQLLQTMGRLTARNLGVTGIYDVKEHYNDVRNKWIGLDAETGESH